MACLARFESPSSLAASLIAFVALGVGEREVDVQPRAATVAQGLAHEGQEQSQALGHLASEHLEEEAVVGGASARRA